MNCIQYGDTVIAYSSPESMHPIVVKQGESFTSKHGQFDHDKMVGQEFGSKMPSKSFSGFIYLLKFSPELWTLSLSHRTQILYLPDISFISGLLELKPGVNVVEAGTGSGSFSHSIARSIAPHGHLYTFEYHEGRAIQAKQELIEHGLEGHCVTSQHRDVCKDGFGELVHPIDKLKDYASAVFLDMPAPWEAIPHTISILDPTRPARICCFSPCIEQVHRTIKALEEFGFVDIKMFECLSRCYEVREIIVHDMGTDEAIGKRKQRSFFKKGRLVQVGSESAGDKRKAPDEEVASSTHTPSFPTQIVSKPYSSMRGHTSYLTFAVLLPKTVKEKHVTECN